MNRRDFVLVLAGATSQQVIGKNMMNKQQFKRMPVLFIGHGSPMNAIEENHYTNSLKILSKNLQKPASILVISAHWETKGLWVTGMGNPKTIHDFYGFPKELYQIRYPAPGDKKLSDKIASTTYAKVDKENWGLDHGTWAILRHIFPEANVPVVQLSLDMNLSMQEHYNIGQTLGKLRNDGVLIIGSGNLVHNLKEINWQPDSSGHQWAIDFDQWCKEKIVNRDYDSLVNEAMNLNMGKKSHPTIEHYLPLLYVLGASENKGDISFIYEGIQNSSISMRSFLIT